MARPRAPAVASAAAAAPAPEPAPPAQEQPAPPPKQEEAPVVTLRFNEPLTWRPGNPIAVDVLLRRLNALSKELAEMAQDDADKDALAKIAKQLASHGLIHHKDKGVRAYTACCLVDVLKLCAPDAPFTATQLKDIFTMFTKEIIPLLFDPSNPYNSQHTYVLGSLAEVKSIVLVNDLASPEHLLLLLFSTIFDGVSGTLKTATGEPLSKEVEFNMTGILVAVVDEGDLLPSKVVDIIMSQLLRPVGGKEKGEAGGVASNQTTLDPKEEPKAYGVAKTICNSCPDKMARYVSQYFGDVIMEVAGAGLRSGLGVESFDHEEGQSNAPSQEDMKELRKAHQLIKELWRAAPTILDAVIPSLEVELAADNVDIRLLATETLGDVVAGIGSAGPPLLPNLDPLSYPPLRLVDNAAVSGPQSILTTPSSPMPFAQTHPSTYSRFVSRKNDKNGAIRAAWTKAVGYIISTSAGGTGLSREDELELVKGLGEKLNDSDEKVRLAAVKAIEVFTFRDVVDKLGTVGSVDKDGSVLAFLADRSRDRKAAVRIEATVLIAKLWAVGAGEMAAGQESVLAVLSGIPSRIFNGFYVNDLEINLLMDRVIFEYLIPLGFPAIKANKLAKAANGKASAAAQAAANSDQDRIRAGRILLLTSMLDPTAKKAFFAMQSRQPQFSKVVESFLKQCDAFNGGVTDKDHAAKKNIERTIQYLTQFFPDDVKTKADLQKFAKVNDRRNYQLVRFAISPEQDYKTVRGAIKELTKRIKESSNVAVLDTLIPLVYRSACLMFNKSHFPTFLDYAKNDKDGLGTIAHEILNEISQRNPDIFKSHIGELCKDLMDNAPSGPNARDAGDVESLKACSSYARRYPDEMPQDRKFPQALISYALFGEPPKSAKYAVDILLSRKDDKSMVHATDLLQRTVKDWTYGSPNFLNKLQTVAQLELLAPQLTKDDDSAILEMTIQQILKKTRKAASDNDPEWVDDADLDDECQAKLLALKIIVNRLRGEEDIEEVKKYAPPTFKLLRTALDDNDDLSKNKDTPKHYRSRLRLLAAKLMLTLGAKKHFDEMLSPADFDRLALVTQNGVRQVRRGFIEKLQRYLAQKKITSVRYYTILFLTAYEPDPGLKHSVETWLRSQARVFQEAQTGAHVMEALVGRLLSLLAHHPDSGMDTEDLVPQAQYIIYYLGIVATEANLGVIYKYVERAKQTRDAVRPDQSDQMYAMCDLALAVMRKWQAKKNWVTQPFAGKVGFPYGIFSKLETLDEAKEIAQKLYIPDEVDGRLDEMLRSTSGKKKRKSMDDRGDVQPSKKAKAAVPKPQPQKAEKGKEKEKEIEHDDSDAAPVKKAKTAKPKAASKNARVTMSSSPAGADRRRSGRARKASKYVERDSSEDDEEMLEGVAKWQYLSDEDDADDAASPTPRRARVAPAATRVESPESMDVDKDEPADDSLSEPEMTPPPKPPPKAPARKSKPAPASAPPPKAPPPEEAADDSTSDPEITPPIKVLKVPVRKSKPAPAPAPPPKATPAARGKSAAQAKQSAKMPSRERVAPSKAAAKPAAKAAGAKAGAKKVKDVYDMFDDD